MYNFLNWFNHKPPQQDANQIILDAFSKVYTGVTSMEKDSIEKLCTDINQLYLKKKRIDISNQKILKDYFQEKKELIYRIEELLLLNKTTKREL